MKFADQLLQYLINGITNGGIYALIALGFTIIYKSTDIINFAQGEFVMLGAVFMSTLYNRAHLSLPVSFGFSVLAVAAVGILMEVLMIHPLRDGSVISQIMATIGASIFFRGSVMLIWGRNDLFVPFFSCGQPYRFFSAIFDRQYVWILVIALISMGVLHLFYEKTTHGKAMTACSANKKASMLVGINVQTMVILSFGLSAALGAVAGGVLAPFGMKYDSGVTFGLKGFCAAIVGGLGNNVGAMVGGFVLGVVEELGAGLISSNYKNALSFCILLAVLLIRPQGILFIRSGERV
ncbi:MAG: branched-chain amino acid ABC transporter permease [bacterium]|nr:branched-chain amino acid ABC transporter permease [bacterium]